MLGRTSFASVSTLVVLAAVQAQPARAQAPTAQAANAGSQASAPRSNDPQSTGDQGLQDIVVTATRQATDLQKTPIAITAVTSEALDERGIVSMRDLSSVVPNAQFKNVQLAFGPGVSAFIRGIGSGDTSLGGLPAVAFYIDDVYYPLVLDSNFDLLDIDHIEVLRGPQGTLFGRNALAGAVNIVVKQPSTTENTGYADITTGSFSRLDARAGFNLALSDNAALRVSAMSKQREGYQTMLDFTCEMNVRGTPALAGSFPESHVLLAGSTNFTPGDCTIGHLGGQDVKGGRASFLWEPTSSLKITLTTDYIHDTSENTPESIVDIDPTRANTNMRSEAAYFGLTFDNRFMTGSPYSTYVTYDDRIPAGTVIPGNTYYNGTVVNGTPTRGGYVLDPHIDDTDAGYSAKVVWDLGHDMTLTGIAGYRKLHDYHTDDTDGTPLVVEHTVNDIDDKYWNAEVRLAGKSQLIDWVVGGFYFDGHGVQHAALIQPDFGGLHYLYTTYDPDSKALFANATVRPFGDQFGELRKVSFVLGARWSKEQEVVNFSNVVDVSPSPSDIRFIIDLHQQKVNWKAGINYQLTDDVMLYTSAATGNSLPGYNARPLQPDQVAQYDGNQDTAYELGAKLELLDHRLRLNAAGFYTDFSTRPSVIGGAEALLDVNGNPVPGNQQLVPLPGGPAGSTQCSTVTVPTNTGITCIGRTYYRNLPATIRGFELEYAANPFGALTINGSVGWSKFWSPDIAAETANRRQPNPFWTANSGIQYAFGASAIDGTITPRLDWTFESSQIVSGTSTALNYLLPSHSIFNARITYENDPLDFSVALGATNLFNSFSWINVFDYQPLGYPQTNAQPAPPREWYLEIRKSFR